MATGTYNSGSNQRRVVAFVVIVAIHLFIGWAFVSGFAQDAFKKYADAVKVSIIKPDDIKDTPPPPPKVDLIKPPPIAVPPPLINIAVPIDAPAPIVTDRPPPPSPPVRAVVNVASTPVKTTQQPDCGEDYYPAQALRLGQSGSATVKVCIGLNNKIDRPIEVLTSSGTPSLDEAAGKCMSAGRFKAATVEGKAVASCKDYKVTFKPKDSK